MPPFEQKFCCFFYLANYSNKKHSETEIILLFSVFRVKSNNYYHMSMIYTHKIFPGLLLSGTDKENLEI